MVAPITGPYQEEINGGGADTNVYYSFKKGYKQTYPYTLQTDYDRKIGYVYSKTSNSPYGARFVAAWDIDALGVDWNPLYQRVYARFKGKLGDRSAMMVTFSELPATSRMVADRLFQLVDMTRALRRGHFGSAAAALHLKGIPRRVRQKRDYAESTSSWIASNWLEYWFGWSAGIADFRAAMQVLSAGPVPLVQTVKAGYRQPYPTGESAPVIVEVPGAVWPYNYWSSSTSYRLMQPYVRMGARVAVTNLDWYLLNQLGLINPLVFAYERTPFSFVANWFVNLEQWLNLATDFVGLSMTDTWNVRGFFTHVHEHHQSLYKYLEDGVWVHSGTSWHCYGGGHITRRRGGLIYPSFGLKPLNLWQWERAATAASLLVQQLKRFS